MQEKQIKSEQPTHFVINTRKALRANALTVKQNNKAPASLRKWTGPYVPEVKPEGTALPVTLCAASKKPGKWPNGHYQYGDGDTPVHRRPGSNHSHIKSRGL